MKHPGGRGLLASLLILLVSLFGCGLPAESPLTAASAQATLDSWNPSYCKVSEFYGLYKPEGAGIQVAYVNLLNPSDKAQKPAIYAATFQLLRRPDGQLHWFMTSLLTHGQGLFAKRQGWDNLMVPIKGSER
ncbi:MAG: hypothetical protein M1438_09810 [Deltaproteobacteria bacterium]|nr:hypothetical protein [Deltaproteobacteria bacterium]